NSVVWWNLRPRNILLTDDGYAIINPMTLRTLTQVTTKESLPFIAPELIKPALGEDSSIYKSDIWSIGITLFYLATGYMPYDDNLQPAALSRMIVEDPIPKIEDESREDLRDVLDLCLSRDPNRRFN